MLKHSMKTIHLDRYKVLTGSAIKLIAVLAMLSGHITKFYFHHFTGVSAAWPTATWFTIAGRVISFHQLLLMLGKFAFPLFVFSLIEGFEKTHDRKKYGLRLLILAILSEIPFDLMISGTIYDPEHNNVIITLFMGFLALCGLEYFKKNRIISFLIVLGLFLASRYMNADYRSGGFLFILLIYVLRKACPDNSKLNCQTETALVTLTNSTTAERLRSTGLGGGNSPGAPFPSQGE